VYADVLVHRIAAAVAQESRERLQRTRFELAAQDIARHGARILTLLDHGRTR